MKKNLKIKYSVPSDSPPKKGFCDCYTFTIEWADVIDGEKHADTLLWKIYYERSTGSVHENLSHSTKIGSPWYRFKQIREWYYFHRGHRGSELIGLNLIKEKEEFFE